MDCKLVLTLAVLIACAVASPRHEHKYEPSASNEPPEPAPACPCGRSYFPLCASDGRTYNNPCLFECSARAYAHKHADTQEKLRVLFQGRCEEDEHSGLV